MLGSSGFIIYQSYNLESESEVAQLCPTLCNLMDCSLPGSSVCAIFLKHVVSVQFSCSAVSDSSWPNKSQHARPPCPSQLPEFTQTHVHRVSDAIQPSHPLSSPSPPLSSPSPPAPNPSQHQGLFQWVVPPTLQLIWEHVWAGTLNPEIKEWLIQVPQAIPAEIILY